MRPLALTDPYGGRFPDPEPEEVERDLAIHEAVESIIRLYRMIGKESAHWICTSAIIAGEREAARNANG